MKKSFDYKKISNKLLGNLSSRTRNIILRRFGLRKETKKDNGNVRGETLESIGKDYGITRERVRQIEKEGLNKLRAYVLEFSQKSDWGKMVHYFSKALKDNGNLRREDKLLLDLGGLQFRNFVYFFLTLSPKFIRLKGDERFYPIWSLDKNSAMLSRKISLKVLREIKGKGKPVSKDGLCKIYRENARSLTKKILNKNIVNSYLEALRDVVQGVDGRFGLNSWAEINPKGVKDKAYLVFKKAKKPLHFKEVVKMIGELNRSIGGGILSRGAHLQTVHNELIRNKKFVLVGRGIYSLKEWGYEPGRVRDVIYRILNASEKPLTKKEVINAVLRRRRVKDSTILINLQNKNYFQKDENQRYKIREA